jgi:multidrug efflux pump subunit AcrA (membrane-fusion protein)
MKKAKKNHLTAVPKPPVDPEVVVVPETLFLKLQLEDARIAKANSDMQRVQAELPKAQADHAEALKRRQELQAQLQEMLTEGGKYELLDTQINPDTREVRRRLKTAEKPPESAPS